MLYVECYADEALSRSLGVPRSSVRHEHGKYNIANRLRELDAGTGLVDHDHDGIGQGEFKNYAQIQKFGGIILAEHKTKPKLRLVVVCPRLEEWLLAKAKTHAINPSDFGLPPSADRLHSIPRYDRLPKFLDFLKRLQELDPEMKRLSEWICAG